MPSKSPTLITAAGLLLLAWTAGMAGDYHTGTDLVCSDCHVMHFSQQHGYSPGGGGFFIPPESGGPWTYLLRNEVNDLCLTCHDGSAFAPDVLDAQTGSVVRNAGALNRSGVAPYETSDGHTLDSTEVAPGGTWEPETGHVFQCTDCHQPHGYGGPPFPSNPYRNLRYNPGTATPGTVTYEIGAFTAATNGFDVIETAAAAYDIADVNYQEPNSAESGYADWCKACHTLFHGTVGGSEVGGTGGEGFGRHPAAGVDIGALGGGHSSIDVYWDEAGTKDAFVKVMSATGGWPVNGSTNTAAAPPGLTPSCFSCHKSHGNQNVFGLIYMGNTAGAGVTEEGTAGGTYQDLCMQCHVQG